MQKVTGSHVTYECAIVGESLAGAEAAIVASRLSMRTAWFVASSDSGGLDSLGLITRPDGVAVWADDYKRQVLVSLSETVELLGPVEKIGYDDGCVTLQAWDETFKAMTLVYAPFGVESGVARFPRSESFLGRGLICDASSESRFLDGKRVVVVGDGYRAAEQAIVASRYAKTVLVLSRGNPDFHDLSPVLQANSAIDVMRGAVREARAGSNGWLISISISSTMGALDVGADFVVLATDLHVEYSVFGSDEDYSRLTGMSAVSPAGLAAGVPHHDRISSRHSGVKAVGEARP